MYYSSVEIEEDLKCSFCSKKFTDVVKLLPGCGESICGQCHGKLLEKSAQSRKFKCLACSKSHEMPVDGLTDIRGLSRIVKRRKIDRPLSEHEKTLKIQIEAVQARLSAFSSFNGDAFVNDYCDQLVQQAAEAVENARKELREVEEDLLKQIKHYRAKCLHNLATDAVAVGAVQAELRSISCVVEDLSRELSRSAYAFACDQVVEAARNQIATYEKRLDAMESELKTSVFSGEMMRFEQTPVDQNSFARSFRLLVDEIKPVVRLIKPDPCSQNTTTIETTVQPKSGRKSVGRRISRCPSDKKARVHVKPDPCSQDLKTMEMTIQPKSDRIPIDQSDTINQILFLPGEKAASCSSDKKIRIWNAKNCKELFELRGHTDSVLSLALLSHGWLASGSKDKFIKIFDLAKREEARTLYGHTGAVVALKTLKNQQLASYSSDETVKIWAPYSRTNSLLVTIKAHGSPRTSAEFSISSSGHLVTCSSIEKNAVCVLRFWNPLDGQLVKAEQTSLREFRCILVLSNDQVAFGFEDGAIRIVDLADEAGTRTREGAHERGVDCLAQLPNRNLVSCGCDEGRPTIKIWTLADLSLIFEIKSGHLDEIVSLSVSPDEKYLASGSRDKTIKFWSIIFK